MRVLSLRSWRWLALVAGLAACQPIEENLRPPVSAGQANFSKYVAVGNSLTAGFADGGLYRESQLNAYPNLLAQQFAEVGGGAFVQPLFSTQQASGTGYARLTKLPTLANPVPTLVAVLPGGVRGVSGGRLLYTKFTGPNQNLGVPGIRMADVLQPGYGSTQGNPYFERLLPDNTPNRTYLDYVSDNLAGATFFTCWMGNNDVLGYATSGGVDPITPTDVFTTNLDALLAKLAENNRKGVVLGIPDVTTAPFFTTVTLAQLNAAFRAINPNAPTIPALVIQTQQGIRQSQAGDLFLLTHANSVTGAEYFRIGRTDAGTQNGPYGLSATNPLPSRFILDAGEVATTPAQIRAFNALMKQRAEARGLAFVDPNGILAQLAQANGLTQDGVSYNLSYIQGGVISLDGIHLTPAGNALMANEIINAINTTYGASLAKLNTSRYRRVLLQAQ